MGFARIAARALCLATMLSSAVALPAQAQQPLATFKDPLGGTSLGPAWSIAQQTLGSIAESGGTLNLAPNASSGTTQLIVRSASPYSLIGSSGFVQVAQVVSGAGNVNSRFKVYLDGSNTIEWIFESGTLSAVYTVKGITTTAGSLPYASDISWWRIREASGTVYWETAPDGLNWRVRASVANTALFALTALYPEFYVETFGAGLSAPGVARYANFNTVPVRPPVESLVDAFSGTSIPASVWDVFPTNGQATESGGSLNLAPNANTGAAQVIVSSSSVYSLPGSSAWVQVPSVVSAAGSVKTASPF